MANLVWSIALAVLGITGLWLAGSQRRIGWALGLVAQLAWLIFGITSGQYGFIASAIAYGIVYARNFRRARTRAVRVHLVADTSRFMTGLALAHAAARRGDA